VIYCVILAAIWKSGGLPRQGDESRHARLSACFSGVAASEVVSIFNAHGDRVTGVM
jgi:hypothetical protein